MAQQGILWNLVAGFDPLGQRGYAGGLQEHQRQQTILEQLAGQREDRQFARDRFGQEFQYRQTNDAANRALQERQLAQNAHNQNAMRSIQQQQLELQRQQFERGEIPTGFERDPNNPGNLRPRVGGPQDPGYIRSVTDARPQKTVPFGIQNAEKEDIEAVQGFNTINAELSRFGKLIESGNLPLGPTANLEARGRNFMGMSNEQSRNFASFQATLEKLRNDSLRLNKGVQTEGDSQRAWNELVTNINDPKVVQQRLAEIQRLNAIAADFKKNLVVQRREDNRLPAYDFNRVLTQGTDPLSQARAAIANGADRNAVIQRLQQNGINPQGL